MTPQFHFVGDLRCRLGESPLWDWRAGLLWCVDSVRNRIIGITPSGDCLHDWSYDVPIGSLALADGGLIAAMGHGFAHIDGTSGAMRALESVRSDTPGLRMNDGKADRQGRFVAGEISSAEGLTGAVWQWQQGKPVRAVIDGVSLSNAICFSPDGQWMYFSDTMEGIIRRYPYDPATGAVGAGESFADCRSFGTVADGATVDSSGCLWVALVLDQALARLSPEGELLDRIAMPMPYPSCPAFGGAGMDMLFVTSIGDSGHRLVTDHPDGGRLLALSGLGITGIPETVCPIHNHMGE